ncbi:type II secretion system F family protein [Corynebacterium guangdongense]|uniref:Pilus assembly protein TadC n=1 Tax=Corynebacterium guangdongense TaxID=1783348 RepID=A0ABU2A0X8_9CORY|nr:type II secretion system F family protein [Corynebacterium guangdongense]MDR7330821.1 pilus assembly protein TadC [Corynebacterium guangdongense]WJZ16836.1 Bacterial type II secretion system protein F domain protein [Corynebacterium guangdongense]
MTLTLILLCASLTLTAPGPAGRLLPGEGPEPRRSPKTPRDGPHPVRTAAELEIYAACMDAGLSPAAASTALAAVAGPATARVWAHVGALLSLGIPSHRAWDQAIGTPGLDELARTARLADRSGAASADATRRIAAGLRAEAADQSTARAERASVLIAIPLTACFLPAFLILGLAPVIISLASTMF